MFAHQRHQLGRVLSVHFPLYILIDPGIDFVTGRFFLAYAFEHTQKSQHRLVGKLLLMMKAVSDLLDDGSDFHNLCVLMSDSLVFLLVLKECKDFVRRNIFHGKPPFESQAGIVQQLVECVAVSLKLARCVFHGHILHTEQDQCLALPIC